MPTRYSHTNIVAQDPERLATFYSEVLDCPRAVERHLSQPWLGQGMGLPGARLHVIHVSLPGCGDGGATLEIFKIEGLEDEPRTGPRRPGLMHTAFAVDDIRETLSRLLAAGGETLGEIAEADLEGVGHVAFVYARDPEGNIVELQEYA
jgi:catechol 2,3-dioxygenase-like lactoylglutathione lyase family enzyme